jgi:hypothetical protein
MKQTLIESRSFIPQNILLSEGKVSERGNPLVEGILATVEVKNGNGRYYSREIWENAIGKYMALVNEHRALGELDHPDSQIINLKNVSHNIIKIWWDGDYIMGIIEILPTSSGNILKALIENNITVGVSSRGMGSLKPVGEVQEVQDDYELIAWDFVSTPSNPGSWMKPVKGKMNENKNPNIDKYSKVNSIITEILCSKGQCPVY